MKLTYTQPFEAGDATPQGPQMIPISHAEFDRAVEAALASIPEDLQRYLENVIIEVRARPDAEFMEAHEAPDDLLGLYVGVPLEDKGASAFMLPDRIVIFRDNLTAMCASREELIEEIRVTVLHEIGHHFGLDEDRLEELGYD
jgi:predicted Zn-dependent protease with MMP-like domain